MSPLFPFLNLSCWQRRSLKPLPACTHPLVVRLKQYVLANGCKNNTVVDYVSKFRYNRDSSLLIRKKNRAQLSQVHKIPDRQGRNEIYKVQISLQCIFKPLCLRLLFNIGLLLWLQVPCLSTHICMFVEHLFLTLKCSTMSKSKTETIVGKLGYISEYISAQRVKILSFKVQLRSSKLQSF